MLNFVDGCNIIKKKVISLGNKKLDEFKNKICKKRVAVLGIGISNIPAIKYLLSMGAKISARDKKENLPDEVLKLEKLGVEFVLGEHYLDDLENFDYIFRSPGVKPFTYNIAKAVELGAALTSEIEKVIELSPCKVIGVTGSDGKTTTTTLIAKFLEHAGYKVWLGGNIGNPLFSKLDLIKKDDVVVLELSSFQLMTLSKSVDIAVITNISPNHLDYHRDYNEYIMAKSNIFVNQRDNDILVLNKDNDLTQKYLRIIEDRKIKTNIRAFSVEQSVLKGVYLKNKYIVSNIKGKNEKICTIDKVKLVGVHNLANICAAATAVYDMVKKEDIEAVITTFSGVEHRMELVKQENNIRWYNDSIGTSPSRTIAGLKSFNGKVILIAGGYDKNIPYEPLAPYILDKVKHLILIGKTATKIRSAVISQAKKQDVVLAELLDIVEFNTLEECVEYANKIAKEGDTIVMSPASASFDMYKNFEERGNHFKRIVSKL